MGCLQSLYMGYDHFLRMQKKQKRKLQLEKQISHLQRQYYISQSEDILTQIKHSRTLLNDNDIG